MWFDADVLRINYDEHGTYLGEFFDEERILVINTDGTYYTTSYDLTAHFEDNILRIEKWDPEKVWSLIQWNGELKYFYGKRFKLDDAQAKIQSMLGEDKDSRIEVLSDREEATFRVNFADEAKPALEIHMSEFIDEKSAKAKGKRVTTLDVASIEDITPEPEPEPGASPQSNGESGLRLEGQEGDIDIDDEPEEENLQSPISNDQSASIEVEGVTMTFEKPQDTQLDLF